MSGTPRPVGLPLPGLPLAVLPLPGLPHQCSESGWYFKSLKYLYVANRVGFRVSSSGLHGSCGGGVKVPTCCSLGSTNPDRLVTV